MPKVKDGYLQEKRNEILSAAYEVCKRKPVYDVTMSDIVAETGMSQGGVYKYFNNIYSVFAALIDNANLKGNQIERIDEIMISDEKPEIKLEKLFSVSETYFSEMLISYNKILFEISTLSLQNPEIGKRISEETTTTTSVFGYLTHCVSELITKQVEIGYFKPIVPVVDVLTFIVSSFDGIIRDVTLNKCYNVKSDGLPDFDEKSLIFCLYLSTTKLLGM